MSANTYRRCNISTTIIINKYSFSIIARVDVETLLQ